MDKPQLFSSVPYLVGIGKRGTPRVEDDFDCRSTWRRKTVCGNTTGKHSGCNLPVLRSEKASHVNLPICFQCFSLGI